jgi:hypothetical protein
MLISREPKDPLLPLLPFYVPLNSPNLDQFTSRMHTQGRDRMKFLLPRILLMRRYLMRHMPRRGRRVVGKWSRINRIR